MGGSSSERDVSIKTGNAVIASLSNKYSDINSIDVSTLVGVKSSHANFDRTGLFSLLYLNVRISIMEFADREIGLEFSTT